MALKADGKVSDVEVSGWELEKLPASAPKPRESKVARPIAAIKNTREGIT
jgi:hypothetical protein